MVPLAWSSPPSENNVELYNICSGGTVPALPLRRRGLGWSVRSRAVGLGRPRSAGGSESRRASPREPARRVTFQVKSRIQVVSSLGLGPQPEALFDDSDYSIIK